ncbi:LysR family transcriptional regulator [Methylobacterium sp. NEAU 140]|uniref:LysR family transcriptional regulator n=1 Tax=Methylobacterium sp. NEAU 140 TaxID=3064945 RepID=UPI0027364DA8|nr:LysR family transcriptional regulator [Methylobacterium sp. NEAU 140]MDP4023458.1 LysR family transcriptional regulator [Methylobacterium sp. NEAU 140]
MMDLAQLDLFRAVLRHGGMTRAAAALGIGQPHVSRAIARLEAELGFPLFVRGHGSALPTAEGEAFAREVARSYAGLDQLRRAAQEIRDLGTGPLRVACQPSLAARLVPRAVRLLSEAHPGARVAIHVPSPDTIWAWVASGQCDLGLARPRSGHAGVASVPFLRVDAVCALHRRHPLAVKRAITVHDLAEEPLIAGAPGDFQAAVEAAFASAGLAPRFPFTAQYTAARCGLAAEGLGVAIVDPVPARDLAHLPVVLRPLRPRLAIETVLLQPAGRPPGILAQRFVDLLLAERDALAGPDTGPGEAEASRTGPATSGPPSGRGSGP